MAFATCRMKRTMGAIHAQTRPGNLIVVRRFAHTVSLQPDNHMKEVKVTSSLIDRWDCSWR